ncbi:MAG: TIGR02757 family protein [Prevotella sp.]|nr:TIGR02757 family protein [Prevotella sp.]
MKKVLRELLTSYANRYETPAFLEGDPSWFMHQVKGRKNQETMAFLASCMSYGSRKQFLPKIQLLLDASEGEPYEWVRSGAFEAIIPDDQRCFYRLYTHHTMYVFLQSLRLLFLSCDTLADFASIAVEEGDPSLGDTLNVLIALNAYFKNQGLVGIVPQPVASLCKRPCMFMRWMVRDNSPVDLGIWSDRISKSSLFIPMDTHVLQTARQLRLVKTRTASWSTTVALTQEMGKVFPGDPARGDFALYGADALASNMNFSD